MSPGGSLGHNEFSVIISREISSAILKKMSSTQPKIKSKFINGRKKYVWNISIFAFTAPADGLVPLRAKTCPGIVMTWAPSQYPKRRLSVKSRKVSKPRDWYFKFSYRFEIWQAHRQHCCRSACQISERSDNSKYKSRGFETLRDLTKRRLFGYWDGARVRVLYIQHVVSWDT